jgi:hypothetical protein
MCEDVLGAGVVHPKGHRLEQQELQLHERPAATWTSPSRTSPTRSRAPPRSAPARPTTPRSRCRRWSPRSPQGRGPDCNLGFLRSDAILVVTFITDEDDDAGDGSPARSTAGRPRSSPPRRATSGAGGARPVRRRRPAERDLPAKAARRRAEPAPAPVRRELRRARRRRQRVRPSYKDVLPGGRRRSSTPPATASSRRRCDPPLLLRRRHRHRPGTKGIGVSTCRPRGVAVPLRPLEHGAVGELQAQVGRPERLGLRRDGP